MSAGCPPSPSWTKKVAKRDGGEKGEIRLQHYCRPVVSYLGLPYHVVVEVRTVAARVLLDGHEADIYASGSLGMLGPRIR